MPDRILFDYSSTAQLVIDPVGNRIVAANAAFCNLLGEQHIDVMALSVSQLFVPCFPALIVFTEQLIEQGKAWCDHLILKIKVAEIRVEVSGRSFLQNDITLLHLSLQHADELDMLRAQSDAQRHYLSGIGHWSRVSRVFQEFERDNQLILDAVGEGIYGVDANGLTTFVNPAAERILGYKAAELAGRNMHTMIHHSLADGSHFCSSECPIFQTFHDGVVHTVEEDVFWSKTGKSIDVEYTSTPIRDSDIIVGAVVIFHDVSQKKVDKRKLIEAMSEVEKLKNQLELENAYLQEEIDSEFNHHQIVGKSPAIQNIIQQINLVAPTDATVLVNGESGTGKELIARAIHDISDRSHRSLVRVNCAAIPEDLFESEFFGHTKGAFTGATNDRIGRFEIADGGTLFLDEVGEIPMHLQGKLLRVLQEQQFERVGDSKTRKVDVRIIAATNKNLKQLVDKGHFREDLYFRLNVFPIESVPLRQRTDDIGLLAQHFLQKACIRAKKQGLKISLSELEKLKAYNWPGNIRELENIIERQVILAKGNSVRFDELKVSAAQETNEEIKLNQRILTNGEIRKFERQNLIIALEKCQGKIFGDDGVAALLEMNPTTISSRLKKHMIDPRIYKPSYVARLTEV